MIIVFLFLARRKQDKNPTTNLCWDPQKIKNKKNPCYFLHLPCTAFSLSPSIIYIFYSSLVSTHTILILSSVLLR